MAILATAIVIVGLLCLIDLLMTFGVIRRLREHTEILTAAQGQDAPVTGLAAGEVPASFTAVGSNGEQVSGPAGLRLVAFFTASCSACPERVPPFLDYLRANRIGRDEVLAVISGSQAASVSYLQSVAEAAVVCTESVDGEIDTAFQVRGYPAFCLLDATGSIQAVSHEPTALPGLAATRRR